MAEEQEQMSLATQGDSKIGGYLAFHGDSNKTAEIIKANLQGQALTPFDLDRVVVPTGGGTSFEVPTLEGSEPTKTLSGILVHFTSPRAYWEHGLDEASEAGPPDCSSADGKVGQGRFRGQECDTCPMNEFGSGHGGRGKACKEKRMLFMLQPTSLIPIVIQVPTMSIGNLKQYLTRLASRGVAYWGVITELTLESAQQSGGGLKYSRIVPKVAKDGVLSEEEAARVKRVAEGLQAVLSSYAAPARADAEDIDQAYLSDDVPHFDEDEPEPIAF